MTRLVAIRGAVQATADTAAAIDVATRELLEALVAANGLDPGTIAAAWFTQTPDLSARYPAAAARSMGWSHVSFLCAQEAAVEGALPRTIRTLVLAAHDAGPEEVRHVYLGAAQALRPDLSAKEAGPA